MNREELQARLAAIVRGEKPAITDEQLTPATPLAEAGIDSLDALTILFAIEEEFGIHIPDAKARGLRTMGDIVDAVADELRIEN